MQYRIDGDQMMIAADSFTNLAESPAIFIPLNGELAQAILADNARKHATLVDFEQGLLGDRGISPGGSMEIHIGEGWEYDPR